MKELVSLPNFFLMTLRIFFWSNFLGKPWTVVRVLRPLRSIMKTMALATGVVRGERDEVAG